MCVLVCVRVRVCVWGCVHKERERDERPNASHYLFKSIFPDWSVEPWPEIGANLIDDAFQIQISASKSNQMTRLFDAHPVPVASNLIKVDDERQGMFIRWLFIRKWNEVPVSLHPNISFERGCEWVTKNFFKPICGGWVGCSSGIG